MKYALCCIACWVLALAAIAKPGAAGTSKEYRVAVVRHGPAGTDQPQINGLRAGLEELRYSEGGNLHLDFLDDENLPLLRDRLRDELKRGDIDLIISLGTVETSVAREVAGKVPIVFMPATDPVQSGFVASLATPRTNLTGLTYFIDSESVGKQLEVFKEVVPSLRYVTVLTDGRRDGGMNDGLRARLRSAAARVAMELSEMPVTSTAAAASDVLSAPRRPGSGLFVICTGLFRNLSGLAAVAIKLRVPLFGCSAAQVAEQRVLMTYAPDLYAIGYRGAWYVDRILKGTAPRLIAVETPRKFDLVINRTAAQEIGLQLPPEMLMLADRVLD
jgi:putative tryptophan/tyrosine transport system substrate-binding protein